MTSSKAPPLMLVLSGGGVRAMAFHLGVLKFLADHQALERVKRISTVSGGSLLIGLVLQETNFVWPKSDEFNSRIYEVLREKLCARSLMWGAIRKLIHPCNWKYFLSRANLVSLALQTEWGISAKLTDLPNFPEWSINGTNAENGTRFRFKYNSIGDYTLGYASPGNLPLTSAMAISAAFPGGIGPLTLNTSQFRWLKRAWGAPVESAREITCPFDRLHLYDGGIYDNLGLEPFFDAGSGEPKHDGEAILVSDAGAPLEIGLSAGVLSPWRLKRVADIMSGQSRALRVRTFINYLKKSKNGAYLWIADNLQYGPPTPSANFACRFPTTLRRLKLFEFDSIAQHGYDIANMTNEKYGLWPFFSEEV